VHIFISRSLNEESPFLELEKGGHTIHHESLISFSALNFECKEDINWIFFYSQNGIKYFFKKENYNPSIQYGVMGPQSAQYFEMITGHKPQLVGDGNAETISQYFNTSSESQNILFVTAQNSLNSVANQLSENIIYESVKVYKNDIKTDVALPPFDVLVFTSPLNAKAYLESKKLGSEQVFAIGSATAAFIKEKTGVTPLYCKAPSEKNLFDLLKQYLSR